MPSGRLAANVRRTGQSSAIAGSDVSGLTRGRIFGNINLPRLRYSRLRPACDPPLKAGFVFLGSRLLANHLEHSAPTRVRSQFIMHSDGTNPRSHAAVRFP